VTDPGLRSGACPPTQPAETKHGETSSLDGEVPTWEIVQHEDMVNGFEFDETKKSKDEGLTLPQSIRKDFE
jgi:hypothetical protein